MELSTLYSRALSGIEAPLVQVETHLSGGLPAFHIVGLPETAVRESRDRVRSALINSHFQFPSDRHITVNLAPADLPKEGGRFDLPIALGILIASGQVPPDRGPETEFLGELALDGSLRPVPGVIPAALAARAADRTLALPAPGAELAARAPGSRVIAATDLLHLCAHLNGNSTLDPITAASGKPEHRYPDLGDVAGQPAARRALEIAAAGGHNLLLYGPPGTGKTLLASRLPGILPAPSPEDALTALALHQVAGSSDCDRLYFRRPFRSPHHSATAAALVGGGSKPRPGEISLAHGGVLFLDELPEFSRHALEVMREPLESGRITLSRARHKITYPAQFQLVAAMNPCPCGYDGDNERACRCTADQIQRYRQRISGPLLDRIDLHVKMSRLPASELLAGSAAAEATAFVRKRVDRARTLQEQRQGCCNASLPARELLHQCRLGTAEHRQLDRAATLMQLSGRGLHRTLRVALTIADLAGQDAVAATHLGEALAYREVGTTG